MCCHNTGYTALLYLVLTPSTVYVVVALQWRCMLQCHNLINKSCIGYRLNRRYILIVFGFSTACYHPGPGTGGSFMGRRGYRR